MNKKWLISILSLFALFAVVGLIVIFKPKPVGCFSFNDGTIQGWTLDQSNLPSTTVANPFKLVNSQKLALAAEATDFFVTDPKATKMEILLKSPTLDNQKAWQAIKGFGLDTQRMFSQKFAGQSLPAWQIELQMLVKGSAQPLTGKPQPVPWDTPTKLTWNGPLPNLKDVISEIRVKYIMPGYTGARTGELGPYTGRWLIGNVCSIK